MSSYYYENAIKDFYSQTGGRISNHHSCMMPNHVRSINLDGQRGSYIIYVPAVVIYNNGWPATRPWH